MSMATEVKLPDLGEGIADVTISRWRVKEGDTVNAGDVIVEVATDKVDTEVPAPVAGTLLKILASEGAIVDVSASLAVIGAEGESAQAPAAPAAPAQAPAPAQAQGFARPAPDAAPPPPQPVAADGDLKASPVAQRVAADKGVPLAGVTGTGPGGRITKGDVLAAAEQPAQPAQGEPGAVPSGPLPGDLADAAPLAVRRVAADFNVDLNEVAQGRPFSTLTRYDVLSAVASRDAGQPVTVEPAFAPRPAQAQGFARPAQEAAPAAQPSAPPAPRPGQAQGFARPAQAQGFAQTAPATAPAPAETGAGEELIKHSRMRAAVARNTAQSAFTAPHVTTMWDVEMTAVLAHRAAHKKEFAAAGVNLTFTAYFFEAALAGLRAVPAANATWTDEGVIVKRYYNLGMAVALPADQYGMGGLIVPVIKNAGDLNLLGLARAVNDFAEKARANQLRSEDLAGGTFTITNYGTGGSRFQTPVIVQPQVGILGVGAIEKRAVVVSQGHPLEANAGDSLSIRPMTTLGFSYDHRVLDGATADAFCAAVKQFLENYK
jgi:2-oxoglutarate dehydrogenase E2 component (dihydrolipoamide succinyltransferase)